MIGLVIIAVLALYLTISIAADQLYGHTGNDILMGGAVGDDTIDGDMAIKNIFETWDVTRTVEAQGNQTTHTKAYSGFEVRYPDLQEQSGDIIYGGAGNDRIFAMGGDEFVDGGKDDDVLFGQVGDDTVLGWEGDYNSTLEISA